MDKFTVACVQMRMRLHASLDDYRDDLRRFLRAADAKRARLILFPELAGLMLAPLLLRDARSNLLRRAEQGRRRSAGAWNKLSGKAAGWLASALKADLNASTAALLDLEPQRVLELYLDVYGGLARAQGVTLVAPSAYLPDSAGGLLNQSAVFGPDGSLLGMQARVLSTGEEAPLVQRGRAWEVVETEVGRLGLMLGTDVLYPEVGRVLAYQNAEVLILQGAPTSAAAYNKLRAGILARMQDNQLFAAASFLVGESPLRPGKEPYTGRSVILAPHELTVKGNAVLVEMGGGQSEGVVTAEWDYVALRRLWEVSDVSLRRPLEAGASTALLGALYTQLQALPHAQAVELLPPPIEGESSIIQLDAADEEPMVELDDLPLLGSITSHWPLTSPAAQDTEGQAGEERVEWSETPLPAAQSRSYTEAASSAAIRRDDETDEMDAVERQADAEESAPAAAVEPPAVEAPAQQDALPAARDEPAASAEPAAGNEPATSIELAAGEGPAAGNAGLPASEKPAAGEEPPAPDQAPEAL